MRAAAARRAATSALPHIKGSNISTSEGVTAASSSSACRAAGSCATTSTWAAPDRTATLLAAAVRAHFEAAGPLAASHALVDALGPAHRGVLLRALTSAEAAVAGGGGAGAAPPTPPHADPHRLPISQLYADTLFAAADTRGPYGALDRGELADALRRHETATAVAAAAARPPLTPLTPRTLAALAAAAGLPFVGFGFVDNAVMLTAGEEIEAHFGAVLGLSTLAAAGLGNLVSDVAGLGLADAIEARARATRWGAPPAFSAADRRRWIVRAARVAGSGVGVSAGCLLGMAPLWFM